jgi:hypothetical protein
MTIRQVILAALLLFRHSRMRRSSTRTMHLNAGCPAVIRFDDRWHLSADE